jgi:hypothetical protein
LTTSQLHFNDIHPTITTSSTDVLDIRRVSQSSIVIATSHQSVRTSPRGRLACGHPADQQTMRITPAHVFPHAARQEVAAAPSALGVHDTLRVNLAPDESSGVGAVVVPLSSHPLESRLANWELMQDKMRADMKRDVYGLAEPLRCAMELMVVRDSTWRYTGIGGAKRSVR